MSFNHVDVLRWLGRQTAGSWCQVLLIPLSSFGRWRPRSCTLTCLDMEMRLVSGVFLKSLSSTVGTIGMICVVIQPRCSGVHSGLESWRAKSCVWKQRSFAEDLEEIRRPTNFFTPSFAITNLLNFAIIIIFFQGHVFRSSFVPKIGQWDLPSNEWSKVGESPFKRFPTLGMNSTIEHINKKGNWKLPKPKIKHTKNI